MGPTNRPWHYNQHSFLNHTRQRDSEKTATINTAFSITLNRQTDRQTDRQKTATTNTAFSITLNRQKTATTNTAFSITLNRQTDRQKTATINTAFSITLNRQTARKQLTVSSEYHLSTYHCTEMWLASNDKWLLQMWLITPAGVWDISRCHLTLTSSPLCKFCNYGYGCPPHPRYRKSFDKCHLTRLVVNALNCVVYE